MMQREWLFDYTRLLIYEHMCKDRDTENEIPHP